MPTNKKRRPASATPPAGAVAHDPKDMFGIAEVYSETTNLLQNLSMGGRPIL